MTKESLLDEHVKYAWECDQAAPVIPYSAAEKAMDEWAGHLISNSSYTTTTLQVPKHILDEYAKQQAIEFGAWLNRNQYTPDDALCDMWHKRYTMNDYVNTNYLYDQFIEQQNKDNDNKPV